MDYKVTIDKFEGPLDLLLHLIKQTDINIFDINIADVTSQYLNYLKSMDELNLNVDSEYLVMAASLMEIKSRELLPKEETLEEEEEDPREELINRLIEYQKYKELRTTFKDLLFERQSMSSRPASLLEEYYDDSIKITDDITLDNLVNAYINFHKKKEFEKPLNTVVTTREYSIEEIGSGIIKRLKKNKSFKLDELFTEKSKDYIVATFLTVLDLTRKGRLLINQNHNLGEITLSLKEENE